MAQLLNLCLVFVSLAIASLYYNYVYKVQIAIRYYKSQGVTIVPGAERMLLGNVPGDVREYTNECKINVWT